jgi:predicted esterase
MRWLARGIAAVVAGMSVLAAGPPLPASSASAAGSLYRGPGPRPGPALLYQPPVTSPLLTNAPGSTWQAPPILISGASAYRSGEYLYQDFLYDDHGATGTGRDPGDPRVSGDAFAGPNGTVTYPTGPGYNGNAADLVEFRVKPLPDATAFRVTLNTMVDPSLAGFTIAIGTDSSPSVAYPHGANSHGLADRFVTVHNTYADYIVAGAGTATALPPAVVDMTRRQVEVRLPHSTWDPGTTSVRLSLGTGLWDKSTPDSFAGQYLHPVLQATATTPGGLDPVTAQSASAFFNVAFRQGEPSGLGLTDPSGNNKRWWRDEAQGLALKSGDVPFHDAVDFAKLAAGTNDDMNGSPRGVPLTGPMDRILSSHFETSQGVDYSVKCGGNAACKGELTGQLQPYAIYIPPKAPPAKGYGLTLLLHSLSASYNQFLATKNQQEFGDRGTGSIVITPSGRGVDGWYVEYAAADTFEVWADVASRYRLDPDYTAIAGYSMGGYGTYRFGTLYPDLFYKAQPTVGPPGIGIWAYPGEATGGKDSNTNYQLASMRNVPIMMWVMHADELVPFVGTEQQARTFDALGYRYDFWAYAPGEHLTLSINDEYQPAADWLGQGSVDRNPPHVTYVANPHMAFPALGLEADHAYWLSGVTLRDASGAAPLGTIDVRSEGFGLGDPTPSGTQAGAGTLNGGTLPAIAYERQYQTWSAAPATPVANVLDIKAANVSAVTIDATRARVDCSARLNIQADGPIQVKLVDCPGSSAATTPVLPVHLPNTTGAPGRGIALLLFLPGLVALLGWRRRQRV